MVSIKTGCAEHPRGAFEGTPLEKQQGLRNGHALCGECIFVGSTVICLNAVGAYTKENPPDRNIFRSWIDINHGKAEDSAESL